MAPVTTMCRALGVSESGVNTSKNCTLLPTRIAHFGRGMSPVRSGLLASWGAGAAGAFGGRRRRGGRETGGEGPVFPHAVAVAPDVDDVAVVDQAINQGRGHHLVAKDVAPFLEGLVAGQHRRRVFVASAHELEEELSARPGNG